MQFSQFVQSPGAQFALVMFGVLILVVSVIVLARGYGVARHDEHNAFSDPKVISLCVRDTVAILALYTGLHLFEAGFGLVVFAITPTLIEGGNPGASAHPAFAFFALAVIGKVLIYLSILWLIGRSLRRVLQW